MKKISKLILALCIIALGFVCYWAFIADGIAISKPYTQVPAPPTPPSSPSPSDSVKISYPGNTSTDVTQSGDYDVDQKVIRTKDGTLIVSQ